MKRLLCWLLGHDLPFYAEIPHGSQYAKGYATATAYTAKPCARCGYGLAVKVRLDEPEGTYVNDTKLHEMAIDALGTRVVRQASVDSSALRLRDGL